VLNGHDDIVTSAAFSADGRRIVTASYDQTARTWNVATGRQIVLLAGHTNWVFCAAFSRDGRRIVTASYDHTARIWDSATGRESIVLSGHKDYVTSAAFSPDGARVVTSSLDHTARVWDAATGRMIMVLNGHAKPVQSAAFSTDGGRIVTASDDKTVRIWDARTGQEILQLSGHALAVSSAQFSPDGRRVVTASVDQTARVWDAAAGHQLMALGHEDLVETASFSPDGKRIVTASDDNTARIWDARVPDIDTQIGWARAAQFDPLSSSERYRLGLPDPSDEHRWPVEKSKCEESAAAPYDPDRRAPGVVLDQLIADVAIKACADQQNAVPARAMYLKGRAQMANGNFTEAKQDFERAIASGVQAARVDLGMLLSQPSSGLLDLPTAVSLFERAWRDGVTIAAFELGSLYEHGASRSGSNSEFLLAPDNARAWSWYQKAAVAGEPNALARFAERDDGTASSMEDPMKKRSLWLSSFKFYAAAAERARIEDWPDTDWRYWRYRRASLVRMLAREGMEQEVAEAYETVLGRYAPRRSRSPLTSFVASD
jgi:Tol biopolymer transport system component